MKRLLILLSFFAFVPGIFAESSDDIYTIEQACLLSEGVHLGSVTGFHNSSSYSTVVSDYSITSFYHSRNSARYGNSIHFVMNDIGNAGEQDFSKLVTAICSPKNSVYTSYIYSGSLNFQYSPEVSKVNNFMTLIEDWQNINGTIQHVAIIEDMKTPKSYYIGDEKLLAYRSVKTFVGNNPFYWDVKSYFNGILRIEVRLNEKQKRHFTIRIK